MIVSKKGSSTCTKTSFSYFTTTTKKCIFLSLSHAERDSFSNWNILLWKLYTTDRPPNAKLKLNEKSVRLHIIMATAFQIIIFLQLTIHLNLENLWTSFPLLLQFFSLSRNCEIFAMQHEGNQWISKKKRRLWTIAKKNSTGATKLRTLTHPCAPLRTLNAPLRTLIKKHIKHISEHFKKIQNLF